MVSTSHHSRHGLTKLRGLGQFLGITVLLSIIGYNRVKSEHGDLGTMSFHLRRKTKIHSHLHKHSNYHNKTRFMNGIGRSKDGYSLRVRVFWFDT